MSKRSGFTLIELMIVVIIMAALAGMVLPRLLDRADDAKINISRGEIASITMALKFYKLDNGSYPGQAEGNLNALMTKPSSARNWKGPYLEKAAVDPWDQDYKYKYRGDHNTTGFDLWSDGPDTANSEDDVNNWDD
jgi:general secretion pathway protein G